MQLDGKVKSIDGITFERTKERKNDIRYSKETVESAIRRTGDTILMNSLTI